ncbi:MAG: SUMF1/EgtB/PvdO family nonheme iron enzyme, partial [Planctomycetes bacterium]|nr:SUMF1/EgtB/PvdO family nonheme iron enzyme [Planctomycetota bacterium]
MPRLRTFLECAVRAICEQGVPRRDHLAPQHGYFKMLRSFENQINKQLPSEDVRAALREAISAPEETVELLLRDAISEVAHDRPYFERSALTMFLELLPPTFKQALRRPGDPSGTSVPEQLAFRKAVDWLIFFPDRLTRFRPGDVLTAFDGWQVEEFRGGGPYSETWQGLAEEPGEVAASLKFITHPWAIENFNRHADHFRRILDLEPINGLVRLQSVYLRGDPPCLESTYITGYDATGLMHDWSWRGQPAKPDQTSLIIKRAARIVGELHQLDPPIVHRGLKPSNILLHPTAEGKVTVWVSDLGWGEISSAIALEHPEPEQEARQVRRGALASIYASSGQRNSLPPDPRDDIYALGVIWYQLLKRDPTARIPEGNDWAPELRKLGLSEGHARLLISCVDEDPDYRPANGHVLSSQIDAHFTKPPESGSKNFHLKGSSATIHLPPELPVPPKTALADKYLELPKTLENSVGMRFQLIEPGTFLMGSPPEERGRHDTEGPVHAVTISRPFYLGIHLVTQAQFQRVMGRNPSHFKPALGGSPEHPVEQVSWDDALAFCEKLMAIPEENALCRIYRLPTEAEWEFACRAGTTTPYAFGETVTLREVHYFGLSAATWAKVANTSGKTVKVDCHAPNAWGLHDMHGNVMEWCHDFWSEIYYAESP